MEFNVEDYLSNLSYIDKDFNSLWYEILETTTKLTNKWDPSDANESDPLVVLLKELAIVSDKLNYNIDKNILELFPATLTQQRSAYNVYASLGYTPDWYISATTTLTISYNGMIGTDVVGKSTFSSGETVVIPRFTSFSDDDSGTVYTTMEDVNIPVCEVNKFTVDIMEGTIHDFEINGSKQILYNNLDSQNRLTFSEYNVAQNGIIISNNSDFSDFTYNGITGDVNRDGYTTSVTNAGDLYTVWTRVDNLNQYTSGNKIYKLGVDPVQGSVYIQFPDDIGDLMEDGIYIKYIVSSGEQGNIGKGVITKFLNSFDYTLTGLDDESYTVSETNLSVVNTKSTQNGADPLTIEEMKKHFDKVVGVFNTLVTTRDYENYIYEYTDNTGANVVSNIRVSDRYSDVADSLTYKTMNSTSVISDKTVNLATTTNGSFVDSSVSGDPSMTAYDLRLYPLMPVSAIEDKTDFDLTFNRTYNDEGESVFISRDITLKDLSVSVQDAISSSKCISHDFSDPEYPILVPYDLTGQVYLKTAVSLVDAAEIASNIESAVYTSFNSRELEWGKSINVTDMADVIKESDSRIQYVGLDAIQYDTPETNFIDNNYDVIVRSILNGSKAWTTYQPYVFDYGMSFNNSSFLEDITSINTSVEMTNSDSADTYVVNDNETFTVLIPTYRTITNYGNYLYAVATDPKSNKYVEEEKITIKPGVPTKLDDNQHIFIFETRDAITSDLGDQSFYDAPYILGPGTIVETSMTITFVDEVDSDDIMILESSDSISVIERASGTLNASNVYTGASTAEKLYIATTSQALCDAFAAGEEYTLLSEEYFFYTDEMGSELGVIGEGTTLIPTEGGMKQMTPLTSSSSIKSLLNGRVSSITYLDWDTVDSGVIEYELNDLCAFGANYVINITSDSEDFHPFENYEENKFFELVGDSVTIKYQLVTPTGEDGVYTYSVDDNGWSQLSDILDGDSYKVLVRLMLVTGPGVEQQLVTFDSESLVVVTGSGSGMEPAYTTQHISIECDGSETVLPTGDGWNTIQASEVLMSEGGVALTYNKEDEISIFCYEGGDSNSYTNGFMDVDPGSGETKTYVTPGNSSQYSIIPYTTVESPTVVCYYISQGGATLNVSGVWYLIGRPYVVTEDAEYYKYSNGGGSYALVSSIGSGKTLGSTELYIDGFCPLYVPTDNEKIDDPTLGSSYFKSQHPCNKFSLPYLRTMEGLTIDPSSISQ